MTEHDTALAVIPHPRSGEAIAVLASTPTDVLAELRDAIVAREHEQRSWKAAIDTEIARRLDFEGVRSATVAGFKLSVAAPTKTTWDGERAYKALRGLVRDGMISEAVAKRAVAREVTFRPVHGELTKLAKHADERVRDAVAACRDEVPNERRTVSLTRAVA